jgi:alkylation response protein AidB-like acyl-CoA dehydrogenase
MYGLLTIGQFRVYENDCTNEIKGMPCDAVSRAQMAETKDRWSFYPAVLDDLKAKAKKLGLWNMFLSKTHFKEGAGFTNLEYGLIAGILGKSGLASSAVNCAAPDTGNMEVLARYGTEAQKKQWLQPLLDGEIRSAFLMTERKVASSDAKNISMKMEKVGNDYVLNGSVSGFLVFVQLWSNWFRNGGAAVQAIQDARSISYWPSQIQRTRIHTNNIRSFLSQLDGPASRLSE